MHSFLHYRNASPRPWTHRSITLQLRLPTIVASLMPSLLLFSCESPESAPTPEVASRPIQASTETIDWQRAMQHAAFDDSRLSDEQRGKLADASLPLLLPEAATLDAAIITAIQDPPWIRIQPLVAAPRPWVPTAHFL